MDLSTLFTILFVLLILFGLPFIIIHRWEFLSVLFEGIVGVLTYTIGPIVVWLELIFRRIPKGIWFAFKKTDTPWKTMWDDSIKFIRKIRHESLLSLYIIGFVVLSWLSCSHLFDIRDIDTPYTETEMWINQHGFDAYYRFMEDYAYLDIEEKERFERKHPKFSKYVYEPLFCTNRAERRRIRAYALRYAHNKNLYFENITFDSFGTEAKRLIKYAFGGTDSLYTQPYASYQAGIGLTYEEMLQDSKNRRKNR